MNIGKKDIMALKAKNKTMYCKAEIINSDYKTITVLEGNITSGNYSINCDSDIRRTCNITMSLNNSSFKFSEDILFNHYIRIYIGYYSLVSDEILYYSLGIYSFDKKSLKYDISSNEITFSLLDLCSLMDSSHYGTEYGAETPCILATDPTTGKRYTDPDRIILKNIVTGLIKDFGITNYRIDDIGIHDKTDTDEYKWNELPYDLEFSTNDGLLDKLKQIKDLYGIYEFFFDTDGTFIFQEIPCTDDDMVTLTNDIVSDLVISENTDINIFDVKNVIEVWGKSIDIDKDGYYTDASYVAENSSDGIYKVILNSYTENGYSDGMKLALKVNSGNSLSATYISINNLPKRPVYDLTHGTPISSGRFNKDTTYVFRYSAAKQGFYYLSSFQVHAVAIMTNGEIFKNYENESECKAYYSSKYNTDNIVFVIDKNNKYCIENIGELIKSLKDNTYANLETDSIAANYAQAKLNQLCRRSTSLSLEMIIVPWLDVNQKIQYKPSDSDEVKTYITKSINGDLLSGTMSVSLIDFYATLDTE